jgi:hypothetical protein
MPNPYDSTEIRTAGDTCAWCSEKATTTITTHKKGRNRLAYKVPVCVSCKKRLETNADRDKS